MRLQSITLCPFAGFAHQVYTFGEGMNIFCGANEAGKSTLFRAIYSALFVSVNVKKNSADFKPLFSQNQPIYLQTDFIKIKLEFETQGVAYCLEKKWSQEKNLAACSLVAKDQSLIISQPAEVDAKLEELIQVNRAAWEHVLFIRQSDIFSTIEMLDNNKQVVTDAPMSGSAVSNDIHPAELMDALNNVIADYYGRWDENNQGPEDGRGIQNKWKVGKNYILNAWYQQEEIRTRLHDLLALETTIDSLHLRLEDLEQKRIPLQQFIETSKPLIQDAAQKMEFDLQTQNLKSALDPQQKDYLNWLELNTLFPRMKQDQVDKSAALAALKQELKISQGQAKFEELRTRVHQLELLQKDIVNLTDRLAAEPLISNKDYTSVVDHLTAIQTCTSQMDAQRLQAEMIATERLQVTLADMQGNRKTIELDPEKNEIHEIKGGVSITQGALTIHIRSCMENVEALQQKIVQAQESLHCIYSLYRVSDKAAFEKKMQQQKDDQAQLNMLAEKETFLLNGNTFEKLKLNVDKLAEHPKTRSVDELQQLIEAAGNELAELSVNINQAQQKIDRWEQAYKTKEHLVELIDEQKLALKKIQAQQELLQPLPAAYQNASAFMTELNAQQKRYDELLTEIHASKNELSIAKAALEKETESAAALQDDLERAMRTFEHIKAEAEAYRTIQRVCEQEIALRASNPFASWEQQLNQLLKDQTGGLYEKVIHNEGIPTHIQRTGTTQLLPVELLSGGMKTCLALATRMAYAMNYLKEMDGFLLMDDPFTELDDQRAQLAASVIQELGQSKQIIFLTCHQKHAALFSGAHLVKGIAG